MFDELIRVVYSKLGELSGSLTSIYMVMVEINLPLPGSYFFVLIENLLFPIIVGAITGGVVHIFKKWYDRKKGK